MSRQQPQSTLAGTPETPGTPTEQKSIRVVIPKVLYQRIKEECLDHGDISRLVRRLLIKHLETLEAIES